MTASELFALHLIEILEDANEGAIEDLGILMTIDHTQTFKEATYLTNDSGVEVQVTMTGDDGEDVSRTFALTIQER